VGVVGDNVVDLSMAEGSSCLVSPYRMRKKIAYGQNSFGRIICDMMALGRLLGESKVCGICYYPTHSGGAGGSIGRLSNLRDMYAIAVMSGNSPAIHSQFYYYVLILTIVSARCHTREIMVPSCRQFLKLIDFEDTM
jgi:hypothetical protein